MTWKEFVKIVEAKGIEDNARINYIDVKSPDITVEVFEDGTVSIFNK